MSDIDGTLLALRTELAGTYSFERELGRGGMGVVWLAREVTLDRPVAIKVLRPDRAERSEQRERFLREARTGARLAHPNIVPIYSVGEAAGTVYFVMGFIDGESLGARIHRDGPLPAPEATRIGRDVGLALAHAHAMGILHRDVSLDNVLIERSTGRALLVDFGIAAEIEGAGSAQLVGTPAYVAPELIQSEPPSPQSDLYALGVVCWAMLAGRLPYPGTEVSQVLLQHVGAPVPRLNAAAAGVPRRVRRAVEHCLAKAPADRPCDVESWLHELRAEDSTPALALPLRRWIDRWQNTKVFYALGASLTAMLGMLHFDYVATGLPWPDAVVRLVFNMIWVAPVVLIVHAGVEWRALRSLARAGYGIDDLRLAMDRERSELRRAGHLPVPVFPRVARALTFTAALLWFAVSWVLFPALTHAAYAHYGYYKDLFHLLQVVSRWSYVVFWSGIGLMLINPPFHLNPDGWYAKLKERYWRSRLAVARCRVASLLLPAGTAAEHTLHRPTELVLGLAIEDLWSVLPDLARRRLSEVPGVTQSLRRRISEVRALLAQFDNPQLPPSADGRALRDQLAQREITAVAALERLRIRLLEFSAESGAESDFSQELDEARAIQAELLTRLGASRPVLARLMRPARPRAATTPMPTPSPV